MRVLSWNCRGLGTFMTIRFLRELWRKFRPDFLFLSETKQDCIFLQNVQLHLGYQKLVTVDPCRTSGGLALFYNNNEFDLSIIFSNNRMIDTCCYYKGTKLLFTFVYGDPVVQKRELVWERLTRIGVNRSEPWFIIGDLNEEKSTKNGTFLCYMSTSGPLEITIPKMVHFFNNISVTPLR